MQLDKLFIHLPEENWPPTEPGFSQGFFVHSATRWTFGSLPLSPFSTFVAIGLACLVGDIKFNIWFNIQQ